MRCAPRCLIILLTLAPGLLAAQAVASAPASGTHPEAPAPAGNDCGQSYSGFVLSSTHPLAGASVAVKGTSVMVVTNGQGFFALPPAVARRPTLVIDAMGYATRVLTYTSCESVTVDLMLLASTRVRKHGRKKGYILNAKRP